MSEYDSDNHTFSFLPNSNYESFKELLYGSSDKTDDKSPSFLKAGVNYNKRINKQRATFKPYDYGNKSNNKNIKNRCQLHLEKTNHPNFDELQRISTCLTKLLSVAKTDREKLPEHRSQPGSAVEETGLWTHSESPQVQNNSFGVTDSLSFPEISYGNRSPKTFYDVNSHTDPRASESLGGSSEFFECNTRIRQNRQSDSSDDMYGSWTRTGLPELQCNLSELQSSINLPIRTYSSIGAEFAFETITDSFKQPESSILSRYNFSEFDRPLEQHSQSNPSDEMYGTWAQTGPPDLQTLAELSINLPLRSSRTIGSNADFENIGNTFKQPESPLVSGSNFSGEDSTPNNLCSDVFHDDDLLPIVNSFQQRPSKNDFIFDVSPSINESVRTAMKCRKNWDNEQQKKDQHNIVERRRRFYINDRIKELGTLLQSQTERKNKASVLQASAEYIKRLKKDSEERIVRLEEKVKQSELSYKKLLLRIQKLEKTKKCIRVKKSSL